MHTGRTFQSSRQEDPLDCMQKVGKKEADQLPRLNCCVGVFHQAYHHTIGTYMGDLPDASHLCVLASHFSLTR